MKIQIEINLGRERGASVASLAPPDKFATGGVAKIDDVARMVGRARSMTACTRLEAAAPGERLLKRHADAPLCDCSTTRIEGDLRPVIVRCDSNVAYFGKLEAHDGRQVWLRDARYLLSIIPIGRDSLFAAARHGIHVASSRLDISVPSVLLLNAREIIGVSERAAKSFEAVL